MMVNVVNEYYRLVFGFDPHEYLGVYSIFGFINFYGDFWFMVFPIILSSH